MFLFAVLLASHQKVHTWRYIGVAVVRLVHIGGMIRTNMNYLNLILSIQVLSQVVSG